MGGYPDFFFELWIKFELYFFYRVKIRYFFSQIVCVFGLLGTILLGLSDEFRVFLLESDACNFVVELVDI